MACTGKHSYRCYENICSINKVSCQHLKTKKIIPKSKTIAGCVQKRVKNLSFNTNIKWSKILIYLTFQVLEFRLLAVREKKLILTQKTKKYQNKQFKNNLETFSINKLI